MTDYHIDQIAATKIETSLREISGALGKLRFGALVDSTMPRTPDGFRPKIDSAEAVSTQLHLFARWLDAYGEALASEVDQLNERSGQLDRLNRGLDAVRRVFGTVGV